MTSVVLIPSSNGLSISFPLVMLTLRCSELYVRPLLRRSSHNSSVVSVMNAKFFSVSTLVRDKILTSRPL